MEVMLLPIGKKHEDLSAAEGDKDGSSKSPYNGKQKSGKVENTDPPQRTLPPPSL